MDVFGDNFDNQEVDPAAEFLAREQDALAGLENEIPALNNAAPVVIQQNGNYSFTHFPIIMIEILLCL